MAKREKQGRRQHRFWLDTRRADERELHKLAEQLKQRRMFVTTIRQGIELILDLRAGRLDMLLFLFPWIKDALTPPPPPPPDTDRLIQEFRKLLQEQGGRTVPMFDNDGKLLLAGEKLSGLQPLAGAGRTIGLPTFDDDDEETLVLKKDTSTTASDNFLKSMMGLQQ